MVRPTVSPEERAIIEIRSEMMRPSKDIDSNAIAECRAHESRGYPFTGKSIFQIVDLDRRGVLWWAAHYGLPKTFAYVMHHASIEDLNAQSNEEAPSMSIPGLMIEHPALQWSMFSLCRKNATPIFKHWMASQPKTMAYIYEQLHSKLLKITAPPTQGQHGRGRIVFWLLLCLYSITDNILGQDASLTKKLLKQFQNRSFELFAKDQPLASTLEQRRAVMVCINTLCKAAHSPDLVVRVPLSLVPRLLHTKGIHSAFHEDALNISVLKLDIVIDAGAGLAADCSKAIAALADVFQTGNLTEVRLKVCRTGEPHKVCEARAEMEAEGEPTAPMSLLSHLSANKNLATLTLEIEDGKELWDFFDLRQISFDSLKCARSLHHLTRLRVEVHEIPANFMRMLADLITGTNIKCLAIRIVGRSMEYELPELDDDEIYVFTKALEANAAVEYLQMDGFDMSRTVKIAMVKAFLRLHRHRPPQHHEIFHLQLDGETPLAILLENIEEFVPHDVLEEYRKRHKFDEHKKADRPHMYKALIECIRTRHEVSEYNISTGQGHDWPFFKNKLFGLWSKRHHETQCGICQFHCLTDFDGTRHTEMRDLDTASVMGKPRWKGVMDPFAPPYFAR